MLPLLPGPDGTSDSWLAARPGRGARRGGGGGRPGLLAGGRGGGTGAVISTAARGLRSGSGGGAAPPSESDRGGATGVAGPACRRVEVSYCWAGQAQLYGWLFVKTIIYIFHLLLALELRQGGQGGLQLGPDLLTVGPGEGAA